MQEHAGQDLRWFFDQWLSRAGSPTLDWRWRFDATSKRVEIEVTQTQSGDAYRLPLEFGVTADSGSVMKMETVELTARTQRFSIAAERAPSAMVFDPRTRLLAGARELKF